MFSTKSLLAFTNKSLNECNDSTTLNEWIEFKAQIQNNFAQQRIDNVRSKVFSNDFPEFCSFLYDIFPCSSFKLRLPFIDFSEWSIMGLTLSLDMAIVSHWEARRCGTLWLEMKGIKVQTTTCALYPHRKWPLRNIL